jgi:nucleotide-binding universal stress UspA family protein
MSLSDQAPTTSTYSSIIVPMDLRPETVRRAKLATHLADRFSARVIGVAAQELKAPLYFESIDPGIESFMELQTREATKALADAEAAFRNVVGARNCVEWRQALVPPTAYVLEQARAADLIIAARPSRETSFNPLSVDGGELVMDAGRPVLFVPPHAEYLAAKRILVGWKDSREARRAVWDSLPFLQTAEDVILASTETERDSLLDVKDYLTSHGIRASVLKRPTPTGPVGDELVTVAKLEGADLIVTGAYGHSRTREWAFGGVTQQLLHHSPICCLMAH